MGEDGGMMSQWDSENRAWPWNSDMAMDQYLLIPFLVG